MKEMMAMSTGQVLEVWKQSDTLSILSPEEMTEP